MTETLITFLNIIVQLLRSEKLNSRKLDKIEKAQCYFRFTYGINVKQFFHLFYSSSGQHQLHNYQDEKGDGSPKTDWIHKHKICRFSYFPPFFPPWRVSMWSTAQQSRWKRSSLNADV